jgi:hypothetical protein
VAADIGIGAERFGTRFLLFPQTPTLAGYGEAERVWVSSPVGTIGPGPADDRMYVVDPIEKPAYYDFPYMPPFLGAVNPPVEPGPSGHFDHLSPGSREFVCAHLFGSLRRVLDIWESYLGRPVEWFFRDGYDRLELVPMIDWHNAQSGYGYMEFGFMRTEEGANIPHALNFDVIAHEVGHTIMFSEMGVPEPEERTREFYGFHEAAADLTALISSMHFDSVTDRLLRRTHGNLYVLNEINRIAEISDHLQIRIASNSRKMSEVTNEVHDLSRPFTGAVFDILVDIYLDKLSERGLIDDDLADRIRSHGAEPVDPDGIQAAFEEAYRNRHFSFKAALQEARDLVGQMLARIWTTTPAGGLSYRQAAEALLRADLALERGRHERAIVESFLWREIQIVE